MVDTRFDDITKYSGVQWKRSKEAGKVYGFRPASTRTDDRGEVIPTYHRYSATHRDVIDSPDYRFNYEMIEETDARIDWDQQIADAPAFREDTIHMVTGALLPIWDRLPASSPKIVRIKLDDVAPSWAGRFRPRS
ncbi:hypothetical protein [Rhodophyticola porphyridii]|uniref:Uncharacterized protein n=1 Tax=Rhodophyticola porphyridii TaxID=1852017 RepID=A0A3L9Y032_9RHOB|nr:hypothetical protein [Rhodophyticola porphyridii]RMA42159.1 hypothetical protein D9R08_11990 [Rhodophyticola porphyridii]